MPIDDLSNLGFPGGIAMGQELSQQRELNTIRIQQGRDQLELDKEEIENAPIRRQLLKAQAGRADLELKTATIELKSFQDYAARVAKDGGLQTIDDKGQPVPSSKIFTQEAERWAAAGNPIKADDMRIKASEAADREARASEAMSKVEKSKLDHVRFLAEAIEPFAKGITDKASWDAAKPYIIQAFGQEGAQFMAQLEQQANVAGMTRGPVDYGKMVQKIHEMAQTEAQRMNEKRNAQIEEDKRLNRERLASQFKAREAERERVDKERESHYLINHKAGVSEKILPSTKQAAMSIINQEWGPDSSHAWAPSAVREAADEIAAEATIILNEPGNTKSVAQAIHTAINRGMADRSFGDKSYLGGGKFPETALVMKVPEKDKSGKYIGEPPVLVPGRFYQAADTKPGEAPRVRQYTGKEGRDAWYPPRDEPALSNNSDDWHKRTMSAHEESREKDEAMTDQEINEVEKRYGPIPTTEAPE